MSIKKIFGKLIKTYIHLTSYHFVTPRINIALSTKNYNSTTKERKVANGKLLWHRFQRCKHPQRF